MTAHAVASDDAERACRHAARASVADVSLNVDVLELIMNDGAGRACLMAGGREAMLANIAHHEPAVVIRFVTRVVQGSALAGRPVGELLDELHMAPGCRRQLRRIVVAIAGPVEPIRGQLIPLLACHLASLAADAYGSVRVKAGRTTWRRRLTTEERIDQALRQLRQSAAWRIAGLEQRGQFLFSTCHVRASLLVGRLRECRGSDRASASAPRPLSVAERVL